MASSGLGSAMNPILPTQAAVVSRNEANALVRQVNRLLNRQLSSVCQVNGVKSTGIKAELQKRIANRKLSLASIHCQPLPTCTPPRPLLCIGILFASNNSWG